MRKFIKLSIPIILFLGIVFMLFKSIKKIKYKEQIELQVQNVHQFKFENIQTRSEFTNNNLLKNKSIIFIYFNTECEHCQYEISQINRNIQQFDSAQIVFVSIEEPEKLIDFFREYSLLNRSNVNILYDRHLQFEKIFGICPFPTIFIYNKTGELVKQFKGEVKVEALFKYLNE